MELHANLDAFQDNNAPLWVISPDETDRLRAFREESAPGLVFLRDPEGDVIESYGISNPEHPPLPHPTTVVIDAEGTVRWMSSETDYTIRPETAEVLSALMEAKAPAG